MRSSHVPHSLTSFIVWTSGIVAVVSIAAMSIDVWTAGTATMWSGYVLLAALVILTLLVVTVVVQTIQFRLRTPPQPMEWWAIVAPLFAVLALVAAIAVLSRVGVRPTRYLPDDPMNLPSDRRQAAPALAR